MQPRVHFHAERGFALPVAIFSLVVVGLLVTGAFFTSRQEARISQSTERAVTAFYTTERALNQVLAGWRQSNYSWMETWEDTTLTGTIDDVDYDVDVLRLTDRLFFLDATGTLNEGNLLAGASRRVGVLVRLTSPDIDPPGALTIQGQVQVGGSSEINGGDDTPTGWSASVCDTTSYADMPALVTNDTTAISYSGNNYEITGTPALVQDSALSDDSFTDFGDMGWDDIVAVAEKTYSSGTTITTVAADSSLVSGTYECQTSTTSNWGSPTKPNGVCGSYFPIIYGQGNLKISSSGNGQGILLIEGDLEITGGFSFYGIAIVLGRLKTTGTGGHIYGAVMAANVDLETSQVLGNAVIQYSSCAVETAILNSTVTRAAPLADRSWIDLSSITP